MPDLRYQFFYTAAQGLPDASLVQRELNDYATKKGLAFSVTLNPSDLDTFSKRIPLDISAGTAGDVFFAASWLNDYCSNASRGHLLALDEFLPEYAPMLWSSLPRAVWDAARVNGKIYGVPNKKLWPYTYGVLASRDAANTYGLDLGAIASYADLDPFLAELKAGEAGKTVLYSDIDGFHGSPWGGGCGTFDSVGSAYGLGIRLDDEKLTIVNQFESEEFRQTCECARRWYDAGYYAATPPSSTDAVMAWRRGRTLVNFTQDNGTGLPPYPIVSRTLIEPRLTTGGILGSVTVVNAATTNPAAAVSFLESMNTDVDFYRLAVFGIEGKHYVVKDKALDLAGIPDGVTADDHRYYMMNMDWVLGNRYNSYPQTAGDAKLWASQQSLNESAKPSVALGFTPNTNRVITEVTNVAAVVQEYLGPCQLGLVEPSDGIKNLVDRMNSASVNTIIRELQKQVDHWASSK